MARTELYADSWAYYGPVHDSIVEHIEELGDEVTDARVFDEVQFEFENFEAELRNAIDKKDDVYVLFGSFGRWDGPVYGGGIIETAKDLFDLLSFRGDHDDTFIDDGGEFKVEQSHHDGHNSYVIRKLTKKGLIRYRNHMERFGCFDSDLLASLVNTREYTRKAEITKAMGWA